MGFDPAKHPRVKAGRGGGEFTSADIDAYLAGKPRARPSLTPDPGLNYWPSNLSGGAYAAIRDYTDPSGCHLINGPLHHGSIAKAAPKFDPKTMAMAPLDYHADTLNLDKLIGKYTTTAPAVLYRGFAMSPAMEAALKPGAVFQDNGFVSASDSRDTAEKFATMRTTGDTQGLTTTVMTPVAGKPAMMRISLPAGSHMAPGETSITEYVLPRGTKYRVESINPDGTYELRPIR